MKKLILSLARRVKNLAAQGRAAWKQASRCRRERILVLLISPLTAFWLMQFFFGAMPWEINPGAALANWICLGAIYWLACGLFGHVARFSVLLHLLAGAWGTANYFVSNFRGTPILPWDFSALGTAAAVADSYQFAVTWEMVVGVILLVVLAWSLRHQYSEDRFRVAPGGFRRRMMMVLAGAICLIPVLHPQLLGLFGVKTDVWDQTSVYRSSGAVAEFLRNTEFMEVEQPEDTAPETVSAIVSGAEADPLPAVSAQHPNILAIMNESWADFEDFGNITLSESTMDYIKSLDNAVVGHAYTSVFGAGTSTSEFEFLTGDSMAFLPSGSIPYQQYILGASDSLATLLKGYGYEARAFHPGEKTSWQRNIAYPRLGFDSFKCGDDMDVPQTDEHGYVSDDSDFRQVIWEFEHKQEGNAAFPVQRHHPEPRRVYGRGLSGRGDRRGCAGSVSQGGAVSDALRTRPTRRSVSSVEYFEQQTEPTIIVMFGDHQPSVEQEFLDMAYGVPEDGMTMEQYMDKFKVPFVIWANYPLTGEKPGITSLNFLAQYVLRDAGIQTSAFGSYLWNLTKTIPAMTFAGYFDSEGNAYSHLETTEMTDLIRQYQTVQYNELFGGTDRQSSLFAAPVS